MYILVVENSRQHLGCWFYLFILLFMLQELFQKIGFNQKEAAIYTVLYQRGPNPVSTLAQLTSIKRTSVYDILKNLLERGLILSFQQGLTTYFAVDDVQKISFDQKEKLQYAEKIVEELKNNPFTAEGMQINYYKGLEGYRQMYEDMLSQKPPEILGWMYIDNFYIGIDPKREEEWTRERNKQGIKVRLMLQDSKIARAMKKVSAHINREIKIIPRSKFFFESSCFIYQDYICFFHTSEKIFTGIRIHHADFFQLLRQVFEMTWKFL